MPLYHLSNAQKKDLLINGQVVRLALPIPVNSDPEDRADLLDANLLDWARAQLPVDIRRFASSAHCMLIPVAPKVRGGRENLTEIIGDIIAGDLPPGVYTISVDVCVVTLRPTDERRGGVPRIQCPLNVIHDGKPLIEKEKN